MTLRIVVYGDKLDLADEIADDFRTEAMEAVKDARDIVLTEVGRLLRLRWGTFRTAAPEGQPPEYDSGDLFRSFKALGARIRGNVASAGLASDHPGVARLEFGDTDTRGIRTYPHPFLLQAFENVRDRVDALLQDRLGSK